MLRLARPHFLVPGVLLYILGYGLALSRGILFDLEKFVFGYLIFGLAHLSVSFSNDYFDSESDRDADRTPLSGGSGVLVGYPELRPTALTIAVALLLASVGAAAAFTVLYSYSALFLAFAAAGGLLGWFYSAPPAKLSYRGLGEASTAVAAGLVMPGMGYFVAWGTIDVWFLMVSMPLICYGLYFILTVEMPDVASDRKAHKVNILVKRGERWGLRMSLLVTAAGTSLFVALAISDALGDRSMTATLAALSVIPLLGALLGLGTCPEDRTKLIRQVKFSFGTMMLFLVLGAVTVLLAAPT